MFVVGGDNLIDLIQTGADAKSCKFSGTKGGSTYNTAMAIGRQDVPVGYISPISDDTLGAFLAEGLDESNVTLLAPRSTAPTSLAVVTVSDGQPSYQFYRDGTADRQITLEGLRQNFPMDALGFHLASLAIIGGADADAWAEFFTTLDARIVRTLDPNVRALMIDDRDGYLARLDRLLAATSILKLSDEDLEWIYPDMDQRDAFAEITSKTDAFFTVLTRGGDGVLCAHKGDIFALPSSPVPDLVDTVGAGDTFTATIVAELYHRNFLSPDQLASITIEDLRAVLIRAADAAAMNCGREGCDPPTRSELLSAV